MKCTSVILNSFTVPAGQGLTLSLQTGTTVTMSMSSAWELLTSFVSYAAIDGDISFGNLSWAGPLFTVRYLSVLLSSFDS